VEGDSAHYYTTLWEYLHLNPFRAGLVKTETGGSILDYPWSSVAGGYALPAGQRPKWLAAGKGLAVMGFTDTAKGRRELVEHLDRRAATERRESGLVPIPKGADGRASHLLRGWYWGGQGFAERILKATAALGKARRSRAYHRSPERLTHGEEEARRLLGEGLGAAELDKKALKKLRANDFRKVMLAAVLWKNTTVGQPWIAENLEMKNAANVSMALNRTNWKKLVARAPARLKTFVERMQENAH
jgi:hypothetical protein